jgi:hypothetical protein
LQVFARVGKGLDGRVAFPVQSGSTACLIKYRQSCNLRDYSSCIPDCCFTPPYIAYPKGVVTLVFLGRCVQRRYRIQEKFHAAT